MIRKAEFEDIPVREAVKENDWATDEQHGSTRIRQDGSDGSYELAGCRYYIDNMQDMRFTLRMLRKSPVFALSAIVAAGLGIGATSAIFSMIDGVLLRHLPFPRSDRLVNVWENSQKRNIPRLVAAPGNYYDWRIQNQVLSAIGAYQQNTFNLATPDGEPERFVGAICDPGFFAALQVFPVMGRPFTQRAGGGAGGHHADAAGGGRPADSQLL